MQRTFLISKHIKQDRLYLHEWQSKIRMFKCYSSYLVGNNFVDVEGTKEVKRMINLFLARQLGIQFPVEQ